MPQCPARILLTNTLWVASRRLAIESNLKNRMKIALGWTRLRVGRESRYFKKRMPKLAWSRNHIPQS